MIARLFVQHNCRKSKKYIYNLNYRIAHGVDRDYTSRSYIHYNAHHLHTSWIL